MKYALGHAFNLSQLFKYFNFKRLKITGINCLKTTGDNHKKQLANCIFSDFIATVVDDIIDNNETFLLPTGLRKVYIYMKRCEGDDFKFARKHGKFLNIDFLSTNFSGYLLSLKWETRETSKEKPIYVNKYRLQKIDDNVNNGKVYF